MLHEKLRWLIQRRILRKKSLEWVFKRDLISLGEELQYTIELTMEEQRAPLYIALMNQSSALTLMYCLELIESQGSFSLKAFLDRIEQEEKEKTHSALLKQPGIMEIRAILQNMTNEGPKIQYLLQLVKHSKDYSQNRVSHSDNSEANYNKDNNQKSKILIFTQYRDTAKHIVEILSRNKISCSRFVGQANRMGDNGMTQEKQAEVLESFREGDFQVLVATSIAEEGLDIPEVDLVVFYEPIPAMKDSIDVQYLNASTRRVEKMKESLASIKTTLRPLTREAQFKLNPMTADELIIIDKRNKRVKDRLSETVRLAVTQGLLPENEANERLNVLSRNRRMNSSSIETELLTGQFRKQVDKAARRIYLELQKYGRGGTDVEALTDLLDIEDQVMIEAIKKLEKLRKVEWLDEGTIASTNWIYRQPLGKTLNLHIEKVVQGKAVVTIDGKWRARLNHYDYEGPREFLKKGSKFKAIGELYHDDGVLSIKVKQIIGAT
jgi:Fanconi anemia group M protein